MASIKITELPESISASGNDLLVVVASGNPHTTKKITFDNISDSIVDNSFYLSEILTLGTADTYGGPLWSDSFECEFFPQSDSDTYGYFIEARGVFSTPDPDHTIHPIGFHWFSSVNHSRSNEKHNLITINNSNTVTVSFSVLYKPSMANPLVGNLIKIYRLDGSVELTDNLGTKYTIPFSFDEIDHYQFPQNTTTTSSTTTTTSSTTTTTSSTTSTTVPPGIILINKIINRNTGSITLTIQNNTSNTMISGEATINYKWATSVRNYGDLVVLRQGNYGAIIKHTDDVISRPHIDSSDTFLDFLVDPVLSILQTEISSPTELFEMKFSAFFMGDPPVFSVGEHMTGKSQYSIKMTKVKKYDLAAPSDAVTAMSVPYARIANKSFTPK